MSGICAIVNPAAGRGRGERRLETVRAALARHHGATIRITTHRGDEKRQVDEALASGAATLMLVGGDGTWNRCASAVIECGAADRVRLAFVAAGSGNDFAKNIGAPAHDPAAMAALAADQSAERRVDVGVVEAAGESHWFLNVAGFGFDAVVLGDLAARGGAGGAPAYVLAALRRLFGYPGFAYTEGGPRGSSHLAMLLAFSNGTNLGGAFRIAPAARIDDGLLDQVLVGDVVGPARLPLFVRALRGLHVNHSKVRVTRRARFELTFTVPPQCDLDGELVQIASRDVVVRAAPGAIRAVAPPPAVNARPPHGQPGAIAMGF